MAVHAVGRDSPSEGWDRLNSLLNRWIPHPVLHPHPDKLRRHSFSVRAVVNAHVRICAGPTNDGRESQLLVGYYNSRGTSCPPTAR